MGKGIQKCANVTTQAQSSNCSVQWSHSTGASLAVHCHDALFPLIRTAASSSLLFSSFSWVFFIFIIYLGLNHTNPFLMLPGSVLAIDYFIESHLFTFTKFFQLFFDSRDHPAVPQCWDKFSILCNSCAHFLHSFLSSLNTSLILLPLQGFTGCRFCFSSPSSKFELYFPFNPEKNF